MPTGLYVLEDFVSATDETQLLDAIQWKSNEVGKINKSFNLYKKKSQVSLRIFAGGTLKNRIVKHFGYEFLYGTNTVDSTQPLIDRPIPSECDPLWQRLADKLPQLKQQAPNQLTVNIYEAGQGIPPHVDTHSAFLDPIISLSLGSDIVMEFRNAAGRHVNCLLHRRSLLVMSAESRYAWTHGITPRKIDIVHKPNLGLSATKRDVRVSFTFRTLKHDPCICKFPQYCDSAKELQKTAVTTSNCPAQLEEINVHRVYDEIANHFSETRHSPWPQVQEFVESFEPGSILMDIGCGNGKYLSLNEDIFKVRVSIETLRHSIF